MDIATLWRFLFHLDVHVQVQTNGDNTPVDALSTATEDLSQEMEGLREVFQEQVAAAKHLAEQEQFGS